MEDLRQNVATSHPSLILRFKPYIYALTACLTLLAINIAGVEILYRKNLRVAFENIESVQNELLESYLADAEFLGKSELAQFMPGATSDMPERQKGIDAGPTLNRLFFWNPATSTGRQTPLVDSKSREFLMRYQDDWIKGRTFLERGTIKADISFFKELSRFQYWDIEKNSPLEHLVGRGEFVLPSLLPTPETLDLLTAVKVRLMKGSIDGNALGALKETRQFAMLLLTTENFQLVMAGLTAIDLERRAYREYVDREWLDADAWHPIDRNTSTRASRAYTATAGYLRALTSASVFKRIFDSGKIPPGLCSAMNEQLPLEYAYRRQLTGWWPFERGFRQGFDQLDHAFEIGRGVCRVAFLRKLEEESSFAGVAPEGPWILKSFPYFRTLFAMRDWIGWPTHFDGYQRRTQGP